MVASPPIRDHVREAMMALGGKPLVLNVESGAIYRWVLKREKGANLYVTLDCPEVPGVAHFVIVDPHREPTNPISTALARTPEEAAVTIEQIRTHWREG